MVFKNRTDAGQQLATKLKVYTDYNDVVVMALPRGGVPVAYEIARELHAPLDVCVVRKLGVPDHKELAMGAVASGGTRVLNHEVIEDLHISRKTIHDVAHAQELELARREQLYRGNRPPPVIRGHTVILVDDGIATGATMLAAVAAVRHQQPARIVIAVPVIAPELIEALKKEVDQVEYIIAPNLFYAIGLWYENFSQVSDEYVCTLLDQAYHAFKPVEGRMN